MIVPNNTKALGDFPSFTSYKCKVKDNQISGVGYIKLAGDTKPRAFQVDGEQQINQQNDMLAVSFGRTIPGIATQKVGYCALPTGEVLVFSRWIALRDIQVAELADHPFYWMAIPGYLPRRSAISVGAGAWSIDGKLRMEILGGAGGKEVGDGLIGSFRDAPWAAKVGEILQDSVCVYQAQVPGHKASLVKGDARRVALGKWIVERAEDGQLSVRK
jgi:hypothetical protein